MPMTAETLVAAAKAKDMNMLSPGAKVDYGLDHYNKDDVFALYVVAVNRYGVTASAFNKARMRYDGSSKGLNQLMEARAQGPELDRVKQSGGIRTIYD